MEGKNTEKNSREKEGMVVYHSFNYDKQKIGNKKIINNQFLIDRHISQGSFWNVYLVKRIRIEGEIPDELNSDNSYYVIKEGCLDQVSSECYDLNLAKSDSMSFGCNKKLLQMYNDMASIEGECVDDNMVSNSNTDEENYTEYNEENMLNIITAEETEIRTGLREYHILKKLNHKNIARLYECIIDIEKNKVGLVMEYADLGPLMKPTDTMQGYTYNNEILKFLIENCLQIKENGQILQILIDALNYSNEIRVTFINYHSFFVECTKYLFKMLAESIKYLHDRNIAHRDIKPDNILFKSTDKNLKLADFSISHQFKDRNEMISSDSGTRPFKSPESFLQNYNPFSADIYSFGAVIFVFLFNRFVYDLNGDKEDISKLKNYYPRLYQLLKSMLDEIPEKRPNIDEILNHDLFI